MTDKEKRNVIDFLNDILINPEGFTELYSASEMKLLADNALDMLKEQKEEIIKLKGFFNGFSKNAVPIVRCKDCKFKDFEVTNGLIVCAITGNPHISNWFCAEGERRSDDG